MLPYQLDDLDEAKLQALCDQKCPESETLDFKREFWQENREIQKDISALANTAGGDLVVGIDEGRQGAPMVICPIQDDADAVMQRVRNTLQAVEPRVHGIEMRAVPVANGFVLIVRVPMSFDAPHSCPANSARRFVFRNGTTTNDMTYPQIKAAFTGTAALEASAHSWLAQRDDRFRRDDLGGSPFPYLPFMVAHLIPLAGQAGRHQVDVRRYYAKEFVRFAVGHVDPDGVSRTLNLDGLHIYTAGPDGSKLGITNLYRNGSIETTLPIGFPSDAGLGHIFSNDLANSVREVFALFLQYAKETEVQGPVLLRLALFSTSGYAFDRGSSIRRQDRMADRPDLILPTHLMDNLNAVSVDAIVRPNLDLVWQCFNMERCTYYSVAGEWAPKTL